MDGYAICMDRSNNYAKISQHSGTHAGLVRLLEECVPHGSILVGLVISYGSQIQPRRPLELVA
ncbi:hypothetical protein GCM10025780_30000 [Frondihabitans cladoniiphilus]|uniref:Uncharacterized protein n=1 Tax=Frondihabitans cladoniiphilus TaxID=715785 RepID=A0ABP8W6N8_9MICO